MTKDARPDAGTFIGGAGTGEVFLGTSFESNGRRHALIAVGVVPTILETWDLARTEAVRRDEALWRYVSMLVGEDSLEFDSAAGAAAAPV